MFDLLTEEIGALEGRMPARIMLSKQVPCATPVLLEVSPKRISKIQLQQEHKHLPMRYNLLQDDSRNCGFF